VSYTKRQLIQAALTEIGFATYNFDLSADQVEQALWRLDALMGEWNGRGIRLGYPLPASPGDSDATMDSVIPDSAFEAVITNLAIRLAPSFGKQLSNQTLTTACNSLNTLIMRQMVVPKMQVAGLPSGAGNKNIDQPFIPYEESETIEKPEVYPMFG